MVTRETVITRVRGKPTLSKIFFFEKKEKNLKVN